MKKLSKTALFFALLLSLAACNTEPVSDFEENWLNTIDTQVGTIENGKESYLLVERDSLLSSSQGGEDRLYYDGEVLKKIEVTLYGETGQSAMNLYYSDGELIFANEERLQYSSSIYEEDFTMDDAVSSLEIFYFKEGKMLAWTRFDGPVVDPASEEYAEKEQDWLNISETLVSEN